MQNPDKRNIKTYNSKKTTTVLPFLGCTVVFALIDRFYENAVMSAQSKRMRLADSG